MIKQTSVEWLQEQLKKGVDFNPLDKNSYLDNVEKIFDQAKEMEKHNLVYAVNKENIRCVQIANMALKIIHPDKGELFEADEQIGEITYKQMFEL